jgi:peptidoglycan-N-acetylglucosamine deacetylase
MQLVQCWDDGVATDARLTELLRQHGARATFNLNAGLHQAKRSFGWQHQGTEVWRLGWDEMRGVYDGFAIANHSLTHPCLTDVDATELQRQVVQGREQLQQFFGQAVPGFVYPFGAHDARVVAAVREAGHVVARTAQAPPPGQAVYPPADPLQFHPSCHFQAPDFWQQHAAARAGGVFYFWGHSYELVSEADWAALDATLTRLNADPRDAWCEVASLFSGAAAPP